jgi:hypothetical protein
MVETGVRGDIGGRWVLLGNLIVEAKATYEETPTLGK